MAVLHDWFCADHGDFEGSHPICPVMGCESEEVVKVFRKAPGIIHGSTRSTDALVREASARCGVTNFRTALPGESSRVMESNGTRGYWGGDELKRETGVDLASLMSKTGPDGDATIKSIKGSRVPTTIMGVMNEPSGGMDAYSEKFGPATNLL